MPRAKKFIQYDNCAENISKLKDLMVGVQTEFAKIHKVRPSFVLKVLKPMVEDLESYEI
jgi:hypothetical protein